MTLLKAAVERAARCGRRWIRATARRDVERRPTSAGFPSPSTGSFLRCLSPRAEATPGGLGGGDRRGVATIAAALAYRRDDSDALMKAALVGDLSRIKEIIKSLGNENSHRAAVFSFKKGGFGVLHCTACQGHLEVCKHLLEELGGDLNVTADEGVTPFMAASTVKYFLDRGSDLVKANEKGRTVLHHAVCRGSCKPNIIFSGLTPLNDALIYHSLKCMKLLIKAGADVNGEGCIVSPLVFSTQQGGYTDFVRLLLKAGTDPNIPDDLGRLPIEIAALNDCREEVEILFPLNSPIPNIPNWSIDGVISYAKLEEAKPVDERHVKGRKAMITSLADEAFRWKDYNTALKGYGLVIGFAPDATLHSNRSLCKLKMGDGKGALLDACKCRMMQPDSAQACCRQAAAHMLLKEYKQACNPLLDAQKSDPGNDEIERELQ